MLRSNGFTIRSKLLVSLLLSGLFSIAIIAWQGYKAGKEALEESSFNQLTAIRETKARQIEGYFDHLTNQVLTFSADHMVINAMKEFKASFQAVVAEGEVGTAQLSEYGEAVRQYYRDEFLPHLSPNLDRTEDFAAYKPGDEQATYLQYHYIVNNPNSAGSREYLDQATDGSEYSQVHARYHPVMRDYLKTFGYFDIYLVDHQTGDIVYSVSKMVDFGTSLVSGPYKDTNFARVFHEAIEEGDKDFVMLADFEPYEPSYAAPSAFLGSPIIDGDEMIGVLLFQVPVDEINSIMTGDGDWVLDGLGKTGQTYLVGSDFKMRSMARGLIENKERYLQVLSEIGTSSEIVDRIDQQGSTLLLQTIRTPASEDALRGNTKAAIIDDFRGVPVLSSYTQLDLEDVNWVMLSEIDVDEAFGPITNLARNILLWGAAIIAALVCYSLIFTSSITKPLSRMTRIAAAIADGDLEQTIEEPSKRKVTRWLRPFFGRKGDKQTPRNEIRRLALAFQMMISAQKDKAEMAKEIALGNVDVEVRVGSARDVLGNAMVMMQNALRAKAAAANQIAEGNLTARVEVASGDDSLGHAMEAMVQNLKRGQENIDSAMKQIEDNLHEAQVVVEEVNRVAELLRHGKLNERVEVAEAKGAYMQLVDGFNTAIDNILAPVREGVEVLQRMARGDLAKGFEGDYQGEHGVMKNAMNHTLDSLNEILGQVNIAAEKVAIGSAHFARSSQQLLEGGTNQVESLQKITASMDDISRQTSRNAENAAEVNHLATDARNAATAGSKQMDKLLTAMSDIKKSSDGIGNIISVIDEIAFQTNLLALNAAVEAARVGVHGKGFAVVAEEVRNLAHRSARAARETTEMIQDSVRKVETGMKLANEASNDLNEIVNGIAKVTDLVGEIAQASGEQAEGTEQVNLGLRSVGSVTQSNLTLAQESASEVEDLSNEGFRLKEMLSRFKLNRATETAKDLPQERETIVVDE